MPNIKSAKKRVLVTSAKTLQNQMFKTALKSSVRKYKAALEAGNKALASETYKASVKMLDKAVSRGIMHANNVARKKSSFTLQLNKLA